MSSQELVIEIRIPLPEDRVENAKAIIAADAFETSLHERAIEAFGDVGYTMTSRTATRVPGRGKKKATETVAAEVIETHQTETQQTVADEANAWLKADNGEVVSEVATEAETTNRRGRHRNSGTEHIAVN